MILSLQTGHLRCKSHRLAATLTQHDGQNAPRVVVYASRALTDVESRYSQTEREALAVTWACEHLHLYLYGHHFTIVSDHKPLESIFNSASSRTSARIERWNLRLQSYDYTLRYRPGHDNPADFLSRHPMKQVETSHETQIAEEYINFIANHGVPKAMTLTEIANATSTDRTLQAAMNALETGNWHAPNDFSLDVSSYQILKTIRDELSISSPFSNSTCNRILLRGTLIIVPRSLQAKVVSIAHEGHQGIVKTKQLLREKVWFPHMDRLVEDTVRSCLACLSTSPDHTAEPLRMTPLPLNPWSEVSVDFTGPLPTGEYLLVVVDDYSRFPEVEILTSTSSRATIPKLDAIFARHGIPDVVKSDNGPPFNSSEFAQFADSFGFRHRRVTPLWPQANGGVERFMQTLKKVLQSAHIEGKVWKQELYRFLRNYRATPHSSTGVSPAEALYGRQIKTKLPEVPSYRSHSAVDSSIRMHDSVMKQKMKRYADYRRNALHANIQVGDTVLVRQRRDNKLTSFYSPNPQQVIAKKGPMVTTSSASGHPVTRN